MQRIVDREGKSWGYVIYRPSIVHEGEATKRAWDACWEQFNDLLSFHPVMVNGGDEIQHLKVLDFVDYEAEVGGVDHLRKDIRDRRNKGSLKPGVLSNVFIIMPTEYRDSYQDGYGWAWSVDPDWSLPGGDEDGYDGRVQAVWGQLFNKFYDFMSTQQETLKEIWQDFHQVNKKLTSGPVPGWLFSELPKRVWPDD